MNKKYQYIVTTTQGTYKMSSDASMDLIDAQRILDETNENIQVFLIRELDFFEKILDKIYNK